MNEELIANLRDAAIYGPVPCPVCNEAADALESLSAECMEQARLLGMSAEREADLLGKIERLERKLAIARGAMENLVAVKGRYHTEQAYNRIVEALAQIGEPSAGN